MTTEMNGTIEAFYREAIREQAQIEGAFSSPKRGPTAALLDGVTTEHCEHDAIAGVLEALGDDLETTLALTFGRDVVEGDKIDLFVFGRFVAGVKRRVALAQELRMIELSAKSAERAIRAATPPLYVVEGGKKEPQS